MSWIAGLAVLLAAVCFTAMVYIAVLYDRERRANERRMRRTSGDAPLMAWGR